MSKWLSVCIFLLLAIACIVDVEPTEIATPVESVTPTGRDEIVMPVTPVTPVEIGTPGALAWEERTSAASRGTEGDMPHAFATRGWSHAAAP
jgi:hypothetical protein